LAYTIVEEQMIKLSSRPKELFRLKAKCSILEEIIGQ
jgi:hypothetical protein